MQRACSRLRQRNPNLFVVESLFANNEQGAWYDPSDLNTLFQDSAGTVPVTATGQPVGRMLDKSGRGNHATQATAGSRPTFRDVNGLRFLEFDGVDDFLTTSNIDFTATDKVTAFMGVRKSSDAAIGSLLEFGNFGVSQMNTFGFQAPVSGGVANYNWRTNGNAGVAAQANSNAWPAPTSNVLVGVGDIAADTCILRINGAQAAQSAADQGAGNYGNNPFFIGRRGGTTIPFNGNLYGMIVRGVLTTASDTSSTERYLAGKTGVTLS